MSQNYEDSYNKEFVISSDGQNPNHFQVKLPHNCIIYPQTEIALTKGRYHTIEKRTIDSTNDTFILLWGQYNMTLASNPGPGEEESRYLPPEKIKLKHGVWNLKSINNYTAGRSDGLGFGEPNILTNLVDSMNEQTRYFCWQWGGLYTSNDTIGIFPYWCPHQTGACDWVDASFSDTDVVITINAANPGVSPSSTTISDSGAGGSLAVTDTRAPFPYSKLALPSGNPNNPRRFHEMILPVQLGANIERIFGGLILEDQLLYRFEGPYESDRDWIGLNPNDLELIDESSLNQCIISWEVLEDGRIAFYLREILDGGKPGAVIDSHIDPITYDGTVLRDIDLELGMDVNANISRSFIECYIGGVLKKTFYLDSSYFQYNWRHALCNASNIDIDFIGLSEAGFSKNDSGNTLGVVTKPAAAANDINNFRVAMVFGKMQVGDEIVLAPDVEVNSEFSQLTQLANTSTFVFDNTSRLYNYINTTAARAAAPDAVNINFNDVDHPDFHICIENLPIENALCNGRFGQAQKRIYSQYSESGGQISETIEPYNLYYHKLTHKQPYVIDTFKIRVTDNNNRTSEEFTGTTILNVHIRSNPFRLFQSMVGAVRGLAQKLETVNDTEEIQQNADAIF